MMANSTIAAPRSSRRRFVMVHLLRSRSWNGKSRAAGAVARRRRSRSPAIGIRTR